MIKILIIEDDEITNFITKLSLERLGFKNIKIALNGQEGIDYLQTNEAPDLIILDINMPVFDGWDFLEALNHQNLCQNVPLIITTSSARPQDRLKAFEFDSLMEYLEKPVDFESLNKTLKQLETNNH